MLEIKNLTKIYKTKKGKDVLALDNISLKFPETGMIFLLGKSGSGKSTLLNVTGGLDNPTSGEIIIKGKSSKNFTQSDFDSYRNTYIGFIFQEYNILEEFTVYDNIALALELQNKKVDHQSIISLLKEVDLEGYEKRKPNTLSGGQKQRIAIARALIKHPEIIMADEPTGALDSNTGKQVLETLKKLSKDRLVIVVSHDREFAETYADRIIELKDGKIIEDNSKTNIKSTSISNNINQIGDTLYINDAKSLKESDFSQIKEFLTSSDKIILSRDNDGIKAFKKVLKINESNEQEIFEHTNENSLTLKEYDQTKNIFIKSKLPLKHAIKIGVSGLKTKPFRLLFTILLCSISFLLFGLLSTMTFYNNENVFKDTLEKTNLEYMKLGKEYLIHEKYYYDDLDEPFEYDGYFSTSFYEKDFNEIKNKYGKDTFYAINYYMSFPAQKTKNTYYYDYFSTLAYMDKENKLYNKITGNYPEKDNEILLSSYIVDSMIYYNVYDAKNVSLNLKERKDIINKEIIFGSQKYKVVGYFDSGDINTKYDELKENSESAILSRDFMNYMMDSLHLVGFITENQIINLSYDSQENSFYAPSIMDYTYLMYKEKNTESFPDSSNANYISNKNIEKENMIGKEIENKTVYVTPQLYAETIISRFESQEMDEKIYQKALNVLSGGEYKDNSFEKYTKNEMIKHANELYDMVKDTIKIDIKLFSIDDNTSFGEIKTYNIAGIYTDYINQNIIIFNEEEFNNLWKIHKEKLEYYSEYETKYINKTTQYQAIYIPFDKSEETINELWTIYSNKTPGEDDSKYILTGSFAEVLSMLDEIVETLSLVFLYGGIFLCVFALLLLSNFISISISNKTKEIGILRAVGARSIDVFKIFFSESFVIAVICLILSIIFNITLCDILNDMLAREIGISVFVFGFTSLIIMVALAFLTTFIATFIPVRKAAKRKPVESIRAL